MSEGWQTSAMRQTGLGTLHVLQIFEHSYTVLSVDEMCTNQLQKVEIADELIQRARAMSNERKPTFSPALDDEIERTIRDAEYYARILAQGLRSARSDT